MLPAFDTTVAPGNGLRRFMERVGSSRPQRMLLIIGALWMTNIFDTGLTLAAHAQGVLHEANPVGIWLLRIGPRALILYKFAMVLLGTSLLWRIHRNALAELAAWTLLGVYVLVALRWSHYYEVYLALGGLDMISPAAVPL